MGEWSKAKKGWGDHAHAGSSVAAIFKDYQKVLRV